MFQLDEVVGEFVVESCEILDRVDRELIALEQNPTDRATLASIFRAIHTIKGTCSFLGFRHLESVSHVGENLLCKLRDGQLLLNADMTSSLLGLVDAIRQMLASIESTGSDGDEEFQSLVQTLTELQSMTEKPRAAAPAPNPRASKPATETTSAPPAAQPASASTTTSSANPATSTTSSSTTASAPTKQIVAAVASSVSTEATGESTGKGCDVRPDHSGDSADGNCSPSVPQSSAVATSPGSTAAAPVQGETKAPTAGENTLRVDVGLLDELMNLVGELVLLRNQILEFTSKLDNSPLVSTSQRLDLLTIELQERVMKTRMQPIGTVWSKFPRVVRDLSLTCGKQVRVEMEGQETEVDKTIIEAIKDPLTHIIRNSVDHGIEKPAVRVARGKPAEGTLRMSAYHEGGQVIIEITDDGGGIDPEKVCQKAVERQLITSEQAARLSERDVNNLIFLPGFSTAEQITNVSGRGVGMDVVKTNIEKIGGIIDIQSRFGEGTTLRIKIPLTLAIIPALTVTCDGDRYAIPQVSLEELLLLDGAEAKNAIEYIQGIPVYRLRGRLLPLVFLREELGLPTPATQTPAFSVDGEATESAHPGSDAVNIVVVKADDHPFGIVVDAINDAGEIVVKPLQEQLKALSVYAGATILGDGRVALILDVIGLAARAGILQKSAAERHSDSLDSEDLRIADCETLVVFEPAPNQRAAIPLSSVARLEEFPISAIESCGDRDVVQYRGQIMPLFYSLIGHGGLEGAASGMGTDRLQVVVCAYQDQSIGFVVNNILDIVQEPIAARASAVRSGVLAQVVLQGRVTELLDMNYLVECALGTYGHFRQAV